MMCVCDNLNWMKNGWMDWIEWMWKVDVESGFEEWRGSGSHKCTKFDFGWGSAPDSAGGAYSASPDPLAGFKEPTSKGREGNVREGEGRRGKGKEGGEREWEGREGKREGREGKREGRGREEPPTAFRTNRTLTDSAL